MMAPLPEVYGDLATMHRDAMRAHASKATTVNYTYNAHSIAAGNMTPLSRVLEDGTIRQTYFYVMAYPNPEQSSWLIEDPLLRRVS